MELTVDYNPQCVERENAIAVSRPREDIDKNIEENKGKMLGLNGMH